MSRREQLLVAARGYLELGWRLVPVKPMDKVPSVGAGWQAMRLTLEQLEPLLSENSNLGALLGGSSNGLVDVDLDCHEAAALAPLFLSTTWTFGRTGKPRSHWLYLAQAVKTEKFQFVDESIDAPGMVLELRSTGAQTVFPPSIHKTGEAIQWEDCETSAPLETTADELRRRVSKLAAASLVMRYAGEKAARDWASGAQPPALPLDVTLCVRKWLGLTPPRPAFAHGGKPVSSDTRRRASQYLARIPAAISGSGGHSQTLLAAEHLVRGFELSDEVALALLEEEYNPRCEPPWSTRELEHKVRQAREKGEAVAIGAHLRREAANG